MNKLNFVWFPVKVATYKLALCALMYRHFSYQSSIEGANVWSDLQSRLAPLDFKFETSVYWFYTTVSVEPWDFMVSLCFLAVFPLATLTGNLSKPLSLKLFGKLVTPDMFYELMLFSCPTK